MDFINTLWTHLIENKTMNKIYLLALLAAFSFGCQESQENEKGKRTLSQKESNEYYDLVIHSLSRYNSTSERHGDSLIYIVERPHDDISSDIPIGNDIVKKENGMTFVIRFVDKLPSKTETQDEYVIEVVDGATSGKANQGSIKARDSEDRDVDYRNEAELEKDAPRGSKK